jgi:hypothetical protein
MRLSIFVRAKKISLVDSRGNFSNRLLVVTISEN